MVSPAKELQEHELACLGGHELARRPPTEPLVRPPQEVLRIIIKISNKGTDLVGHLCHGRSLASRLIAANSVGGRNCYWVDVKHNPVRAPSRHKAQPDPRTSHHRAESLGALLRRPQRHGRKWHSKVPRRHDGRNRQFRSVESGGCGEPRTRPGDVIRKTTMHDLRRRSHSGQTRSPSLISTSGRVTRSRT